MANENVYCILHSIVMEVLFEKYLNFILNMLVAMFVKCIQLYPTCRLGRSDYNVDQNLNISSNLKLLMPDILPRIVWMVGF